MKNDKCCLGCGVKLQNENINSLGYTMDITNTLCQRCFKLTNYGVYENISNDNIDYERIFDEIKEKSCLVLYVIDILNIPKNINKITKYFSKNWILVLNKRDLIPLSVKDNKIKKYFNELNLGYLDIEIISTNKNTNLDELMNKINKYYQRKEIYVVVYTNAGKSSLINKIIKNYGIEDGKLTVSPLPSTTIDNVKIKVNNNLTIIDTPGLIDKGNIINYVDSKMYKKLNSKREIKPKTFKINNQESLIINNILRIDYLSYNDNSFTFYIPNEIDVKRLSNKKDDMHELSLKTINIDNNSDLVINGLGFIKMVHKCRIKIYLDEKIDVFTRNNLI